MNFWIRIAILEFVIFAIVGLLYITLEEEAVLFLLVPAFLLTGFMVLREKLK
ncbi:hypothetical protein [uncultured Hyphomonas sp.]|jgi:hypothetical protein|uniref:hypothetical protein n=1 Tax=uncultured Hyphomonas sp. TaxID=225298 RepID=UPI002AAAA611|nr:hypothetical protein [uncultured Hyphomonas sp.]